MAKNKAAKAKANHNRVCATQAERQATHIRRVVAPIPRVETSSPRVPANTEVHRTQAVTTTPHEDRCNLPIVTNPPVPQQIAQAPVTRSKSQSNHVSLLNYISHDEANNQAPMR